jgi:hypothetical protein
MKRKHLFLAIATLLAAGGLWLARSRFVDPRTHALDKSNMDAGFKTPDGLPTSAQMPNSPARLAPPDPTRRFKDFTPEQRVEFARKGHGPGG